MYQEFARVYDEFMETIPYTEWADHIETLWRMFDLKPELVLDMACGTGGLAIELSKRGYDLIGTDLSSEMLEEAREKAAVEGENILLVHQDMRDLELFGTVDTILCTCDSLNYVLEEEGIREVFHRVAQYLEPNGLFLFDVNTEYKYQQILADHTFADTYDDAAFIWQNQYDPKTRLNEYLVNFFIEEEEGCYQRFEELHVQKAYTQEELRTWLQEAGLRVEAVFDGLNTKEPQKTSERWMFVARNLRK